MKEKEIMLMAEKVKRGERERVRGKKSKRPKKQFSLSLSLTRSLSNKSGYRQNTGFSFTCFFFQYFFKRFFRDYGNCSSYCCWGTVGEREGEREICLGLKVVNSRFKTRVKIVVGREFYGTSMKCSVLFFVDGDFVSLWRDSQGKTSS